jgi:uncharacterized membrane protein
LPWAALKSLGGAVQLRRRASQAQLKDTVVPMDTGELSEAYRRGRRAFIISLVWPVLFMMSWLNFPIVGSFSTAYARLLSFTIGFACSIAAISVAREVHRSERTGLARAAQVLGWFGIVVSVAFILGALVLLFVFARSDWQF